MALKEYIPCKFMGKPFPYVPIDIMFSKIHSPSTPPFPQSEMKKLIETRLRTCLTLELVYRLVSIGDFNIAHLIQSADRNFVYALDSLYKKVSRYDETGE